MSGKHPSTLSAAAAHTCNGHHERVFNLLAPENEYLDPNPDIHALFTEYNGIFFDGKLSGCEIKWSKRMTLCAGLCSFQPSSGFCSIRLSEPLLKLRPRSDLINTLLHEMIHAYIFVFSPVRDHEDHGPVFQSHMNRINQVAGTVITVYHTFHDEVDAYRQHWWQCDGPCRTKRPYFGQVKRAMNRPPGPLDRWWEEHQKSCGGTYTKIKEPPGFKEKQEKKLLNVQKRKEKEKKKNEAPSVKNFFPKVTHDGEKTEDHDKDDSVLKPPKKKAKAKAKADESESKKGVKGEKTGVTGPLVSRPPVSEPAFPFGVPESAMLIAGEDGEFFLVGDVSAMFQFGQSNVKSESGGGGFVDLTETDDEADGNSRSAQAEESENYDEMKPAVKEEPDVIEILD